MTDGIVHRDLVYPILSAAAGKEAFAEKQRTGLLSAAGAG